MSPLKGSNSIECLSLGLAVGTSLINQTTTKRKLVAILIVLGFVFLAGTVVGFFILHNTGENILELVLSFGSAALLFLVTEELLVEAHRQKDSPFYTGAFFAGFLLFMILGIII
jgi:ZIP family zinc transporter